MTVTDADRVDPANATCWSVSAAGAWTIVVATNPDDAHLLGLLWIARHQGRTVIDLRRRARVRPAEPADVARWLTARQQQAAGAAALRTTGGER